MIGIGKMKREDGWWYPWIFVAGFAIIIAVNGTMAYIAVDSWTGLETKNYFRKAQGFNDVLAQQEAQAQLGWDVKVKFTSAPAPENPHAGFIMLNVTGADGEGVSGLAIEAIAMRPIQEGHDLDLSFAPRANGSYVAVANLSLAGQWELRATASRGDEVFKLRQRIQVP